MTSPENDASKGDNLSRTYRAAAGLPDRTSNEPLNEVSEHTVTSEPEGGYGGEGGILNTGAINATEAEKARARRDGDEGPDLEAQAEEAEKGEEDAAKADVDGKVTEKDAKTGPNTAAKKK